MEAQDDLLVMQILRELNMARKRVGEGTVHRRTMTRSTNTE